MNRFLFLLILNSLTISSYSQSVKLNGNVFGNISAKNSAGPYHVSDSLNFEGVINNYWTIGIGIESQFNFKNNNALKLSYRWMHIHKNGFFLYKDPGPGVRLITLDLNLFRQNFHSLSIEYLLPFPKVNWVYLTGGFAGRFHFFKHDEGIRTDLNSGKPKLYELSNALFDAANRFSVSYLVGIQIDATKSISIFASYEKTLTSLLGDLDIHENTYSIANHKSYFNFGFAFNLVNFKKKK